MNQLLEAANPVFTYILLGVFVVAIIAMFVWQRIANKKRAQEAENVLNNLKIGDKVKTIGGVCGYIVEINNEENTFVLETGTISRKSYVKFDKGAIYQTAPANVSAPELEVQDEKVVVEEPVAVEEKAEEVAPATEEVKPAPKKRTTKKKAE